MPEYVTPRGQRGVVRLLDGTQVVLAPSSWLRISRRFGSESTRDVLLDGEGFFHVAHDPSHPFIVHAGNSITRVLGTEFSVRAYPDEPGITVTVKSGRVAFQDTVLTRGNVGRMDSRGRTTVAKGIDVGRAFAWTEGKLVFESTPTGEALPELSHWFDVEFRLGDSTLATRKLTAAFQAKPGEPIVQGLALALDVGAERHGRVVTFYRK